MNNLTLKILGQSATYSVVASSLVFSLLTLAFFAAEPVISHGQSDTSEFLIQTTILDESSFTAEPVDVSMSGTVYGVTGGQATGTAQFTVRTNNASGYYVEIAFTSNGTTEAMSGDDDDGESIRDYGPDGAAPTYGYNSSTSAQFAYSVLASTTANLDDAFESDGSSACGSGGNQFPSGDYCWKGPEIAGVRIIDTATAAATGATSTLVFNVTVPSGATPSPTAQQYTATATLSLFTK